jgi:tripartite-type tricarboxylate transporter receptor subunit TctC
MARMVVGTALAGLLALTTGAAAQDYPNRALTMIIPFAAGGPQDTIGRLVALRLGEVLGQQVVIENVGGGGGTTGVLRVKNAAPDGYTFTMGSVGTHAQSQTLYKKPPYDAAADFTAVAYLGETPIALTVRKDLPANNLQEFIAYAKENQSRMQFGSAGPGSATHLGCVVLNSVLGTNITHVPYRGTGPAMQDLHAGRIDFLCEIINSAKPHIDAGAVKALAIMTRERSPVLPEVPTGLEQGVQGLEAYTWSAIFLPKDAPDAVVKKLNGAVMQVLETPSVRERLEGMGVMLGGADRRTPEFMAQFVRSEIEKWAAPIRASGASVE